MKHLRYNIYILIAAIAALCSCADDPLYNGGGDLGTGYVDIAGTVEFVPAAASLDGRATAGNAMKNITSLSVVVYNQDGTFNALYNTADLRNRRFDGTNTNRPSDYPGAPAESSTTRATFTIPDIHVGRYYIYAVANMGDLTREQVETQELLKNIQLTWSETNIPSNSQMFGYFNNSEYSNSQGYDAPLVTVSQGSQALHAWVNRAASKVTLVYDGSGLHNDIYIYIHKVTIRDIPRNCLLGADNTPTDTLQLIREGETIYYNTAGDQLATDPAPSFDQHESWMRLARGSKPKGAVDAEGNLHGENQTALYFYENLQGNYKDHPDHLEYYKPQIADSVGTNITDPSQYDYKDNVPCGTYIEVEAYYMSNREPLISQGKIKYRFMLGQDTEYDYNSNRNRHYKLTLGFKGYANQPDWHIEYIEENPELYVPSPFFVSYLYHQKTMFPVRISGDCISLEAEIIQNDWAPYDEATKTAPGSGELGTGGESFQWAHDVWANETEGVDFDYGRHEVRYDKGTIADTTMNITPLHAGFLALQMNAKYNSESTHLPSTVFNGTQHIYSNATSMKALKDYFYGNGGNGTETNNTPQNIRTFDLTEGPHDTGRNGYHVYKNDDNSITLMMPLWTRAKSLIRISGFSGNNPYETYRRKAIVRFRAKFKVGSGTKTRIKDIEVFQVRRVVNPKGVWRRWDNNNSFHVQLMHRLTAGAANFTAFNSEGQWKAYIEVQNTTKKFCSLTGGLYAVGDTIYGDTDTQIDFYINFEGTTNEGESNCAIVKVEYHGFNTTHSIYVRQGYNRALQIVRGGAHWSSYSLYAASHPYKQSTGTATGVVTKNPLALGTFFKRGNLSQGLRILNNTMWGALTPVGNNNLYLADVNNADNRSKTATWASIQGLHATNSANKKLAATNEAWTYTWPQIRAAVNGKNRIYRLPTQSDFTSIAAQEYAFGVVYADGADSTVVPMSDAFGYLDVNNEGTDMAKGMRGVVVFNPDDGNQVFFPVGFTGIGRRTIQGADATQRGELRYGAVRKVLSYSNNGYNQWRPICYNLPANPGSIYWTQDANHSTDRVAWDMNYFDLSFNSYDYAALFYPYGDALPIKLVWVKDE